MYILIWQSVTWRPGKSGFLVEVKPLPYSVGHDCQAARSPQKEIAPPSLSFFRSATPSLQNDSDGESHPD
jgi:hypothetical protein